MARYHILELKGKLARDSIERGYLVTSGSSDTMVDVMLHLVNRDMLDDISEISWLEVIEVLVLLVLVQVE